MIALRANHLLMRYSNKKAALSWTAFWWEMCFCKLPFMLTGPGCPYPGANHPRYYDVHHNHGHTSVGYCRKRFFHCFITVL